jgi:hypothetical protein
MFADYREDDFHLWINLLKLRFFITLNYFRLDRVKKEYKLNQVKVV